MNLYISDDPEYGFGFTGFKPAQGNTKVAGQVLFGGAMTFAPRYHQQLLRDHRLRIKGEITCLDAVHAYKQFISSTGNPDTVNDDLTVRSCDQAKLVSPSMSTTASISTATWIRAQRRRRTSAPAA